MISDQPAGDVGQRRAGRMNPVPLPAASGRWTSSQLLDAVSGQGSPGIGLSEPGAGGEVLPSLPAQGLDWAFLINF